MDPGKILTTLFFTVHFGQAVTPAAFRQDTERGTFAQLAADTFILKYRVSRLSLVPVFQNHVKYNSLKGLFT